MKDKSVDINWVRLRIDKLMTSPDVARMEAHEFGAYMFMLFSSFYEKKRGYLKNDDKYLKQITRLSSRQWLKSKSVLLSKFKEDGEGNIYNERWLSEIQDAENSILKNKARTESARDARLGAKYTPKLEKGQTYSDIIKTSNWLSIEEYEEYRELEFSKLGEQFIEALKEKIGITRPYCWSNRKNPQSYFDLVDCIVKVREDVEWQSSVMINNNISKKTLLNNMYEFVKEIKDAQLYMAYDGYNGSDGSNNFISHFVRWQKMKLSK